MTPGLPSDSFTWTLFAESSVPLYVSGDQHLASTFISNTISAFLAVFPNIPVIWYCPSFSLNCVPSKNDFLYHLYFFWCFVFFFNNFQYMPLACICFLLVLLHLLYFPSEFFPFIWKIGVVISDDLYSFWITIDSKYNRKRKLCQESKDYIEIKHGKNVWSFQNKRPFRSPSGNTVVVGSHSFKGNVEPVCFNSYPKKLIPMFSDHFTCEYLTKVTFCQIWGNCFSEFCTFFFT